MIRAVVFDLDDTLYPERDYVLSGLRAVGEWMGREHGTPGFEAAARRCFEAGIRRVIFDAALQTVGLPPDAGLVQRLVRVYREHRPEIRLFPDADAVLVGLRGRFKLGLLTDGAEVSQRRKVDALDLWPRLDFVLLTDTLGRDCWKPSRVPYQRMEGELSSAGCECVYVGDNPQKDFVTARELGWATVRVCRPGGEHSSTRVDERHEADFVCGGLDEVRAWLERSWCCP